MSKRRRPKRPRTKRFVERPHDALFQYALGFPDSPRELISLLPPAVRQHIDLDTVRVTNKHFISRELRHLYSDCLLEAELLSSDQPINFYLLVEHLSQGDRIMPLRLLNYIVAAWGYLARRNKSATERLPLIIPILIYNGKGPYPYSLKLSDLIDAPADLIEKFLLQPPQLICLNQVPDEQLERQVQMGAVLMAMKHAYDEMPLQRVFSLVARVDEVKDLAIALYCYILTVTGENPERIAEEASKVLGQDIGGTAMTTAQRLIQEGHQKGLEQGIEQGIEKGLVQAAKNLFAEGIGLETVRTCIALPLEQLLALQRQASA